jgi:hypothetical protein
MYPIMNSSLVPIMAAFLVLTGCSKKEEKPKSAEGNPLSAPADYLGAVGKAKQFSEKTIDIASLNQAVQLFYTQEDRFPKDLQELVSKRYIPRLPSAPQGMQWQYNPKSGQIKAIRQQ